MENIYLSCVGDFLRFSGNINVKIINVELTEEINEQTN